METTTKLLGTLVLVAAAHVLIGWWATPFAALVGGVWKGRGGWWLGAMALVVEWGAWVAYSYLVNPAPFGRMTATMGAILGNLPSAAIVAATLFMAALLGLLGGLAGTQVRLLARA